MTFGVDYSFSPHPSISSLQGAGVKFVIRYTSSDPINDTNGKNLLSSEKDALLAAGIAIVIVKEEGAQRMLSGYSAGVTDAQEAGAAVSALGMPGRPIYFACDFDATKGDQTAINAYLDGAASVVGLLRTGIYGGYYPVSGALDAGKADWAWQTYAWSGGLWDSRTQIRQFLNGQTLGGASVDYDRGMATDIGQWPRPSSPVPPPTNAEEQEVMLLNKGLNAKTPIAFPTGTVKVRFYSNNSASLGVDTRDGSGLHQVTLTYDSAQTVDVPTGCHAFVVHRQDDGTNDVSAALCFS